MIAPARQHIGVPRRGAARPPRVLFLADHLGLPDGGVHGVTTYLLDVMPALRRRGVAVAACFLRDAHPAAMQLRAEGIDVRFLGSGRLDLSVVSAVAGELRRGDYNVVHCTQFRASVVGRAVARLRGMPGRRRAALHPPGVILHVHDMNMPPFSVRLMNRLLARPTDRGLCVSEAARDIAARGYLLQPSRTSVLYTGIDTEIFRPLPAAERREVRRELAIARDAPVLSLVGRFHPVKGHREMVEMMRDIAAVRPECVLLLIGSGPGRENCERLAKTWGLSRQLRFLGHRRDVARCLAAADVAVVPSRSEGLSRAAIEANLCGLPVVAFASGGVAEVLAEPCCGELVPPGDLRAFMQAVERALQAAAIPGAAAARVRAASERFGLQRHVSALEASYDELVDESVDELVRH